MSDGEFAVEFESNVESISALPRLLESSAYVQSLRQSVIEDIRLFLEECLANIVFHNTREPLVTICVEIKIEQRSVCICVSDNGKQFDPTILPYRQPENHLENDAGIGGWGIQLMRDSVDHMSYEFVCNRNQLSAVKAFENEG